MNANIRNEIVAALNKKNVSQPCPRCAAKNFSVVGESEISVIYPPRQELGMQLGTPSSTMPTIIVTCDNCGYISQHAKVSLGLLQPSPGLGIRNFGGTK